MSYMCSDLNSTPVPSGFGTDNPPPPAFIRRKEPDPGTGKQMVDKCNKSLWIRYQSDGKVEVNGSVPTSSNWPEAVDTYQDLIVKAASKHLVPAAWIAGFMAQESRGVPGAYSPKAAVGLMQLLVSTAKWCSDPAFPGQTPGHVGPTGQELTDPALNIELGTRLLAHLADKYNENLVYMAGSYNHGSAECGEQVPVGSKSCPTPDHEWGLITNCGYVDGILSYTNRAIVEGYSGLREIDLYTEPMTETGSGGPSAVGVLVGAAIGAGAVAAFKFFNLGRHFR
jgi:hypothetical protein